MVNIINIGRLLNNAPDGLLYTSLGAGAILNEKYGYYLFVGLILNNLVIRMFKNVFKDYDISKRPKNITSTCGNLKSIGHGFPSGHSQTIGFAASFVLIAMLIREKKKNKEVKYSEIIKKNILTIPVISIFIVTLSVLSHRIYYNCHSILQVISGFIFGILMGYSYIRLIQNY